MPVKTFRDAWDRAPARPPGRRGAGLRVVLLLGLLPLLGGCRFGYYARAGWGQASLLLSREPIDEVLEAGGLEPEAAARLRRVEGVMDFAATQVGMVRNNNYTTYVDLEGAPASWTLVACPPDSLSPYLWEFPIVGALPYIGFFDREDAEEERDRLVAEGYDTVILPAAAYSTLGWFDDPVLSTMLRDDVELVEVLLHEQTHATIYIEGDIAFNESLATFVGHAAALEYFEARGERELIEVARRRREDQRRVASFTSELVKALEALYASDRSRDEKLDERKRLFARQRMKFRREVAPRLKTKRYRFFTRLPANNAIIATLSVYNRDIAMMERLHEHSGRKIRRTFSDLLILGRAKDVRKAIEARVKALDALAGSSRASGSATPRSP